jgi:iron complex transport system ATP-binding protein
MNHADQVLVVKSGQLTTHAAPEQALSAAVIAEVWGVEAHWLGQPGVRGLSIG